ncbi:Outer membrane protein assembly factor BamB, contains PQQ-like beta-propeller repeat [Prosthecobacter debontii]|uniref:Outer membrane protein assembly factor BamB, contains PQQ-like beta-propeller repeat n=1 Tax=Prosthecobacter debontii TaxID=48467 RepID=A0A1T4YCG2_9BACT|nr:PQQ-binding-like beta-propeller repeat protein [Prosthecobacter debontii]SKA99400.1 Outer membrane protein assembly factor BamB, contains PQQ-like beta-propeller repeat [Prosthecobacter debontii]
MKPNLLFTLLCLAAPAWLSAATPPPDLPAPVSSFGAAATPQGLVYIYGGHAGARHKYNREDVNGDLYFWKEGMTAWEKLGTSEPAQGASLIALDNRILRIGGMAAQNGKEESQSLWSSETTSVFDLSKKAWSELPKFPERRSSHDSVLIGDTLYVIGGWSLGGGTVTHAEPHWHDTYLTLDLTDPKAQWQTHKQPFKRRALAVQVMGDKLYAIGGMNSDDEPITDVSVLDVKTGEWTTGPALPGGRVGGFGFSAIAHEGRLFASGLSGVLLELRGDAWVPIAKLEHPRYFHRLVPGGKGQLIALGGASHKGPKPSPEIIALPAADSAPLEMTEAPAPAKKPHEGASAPSLSWPANVPEAESDWPGYQGPRGNSTTPEVGFLTAWPADGPRVAWRDHLGIGLASFAVVGEKVYTASNDGQDHDTIWCLALKTGQVLWKHEMTVPTKSHEMAIVPYGPAATPTVAGDRLYALSREGDLVCLNVQTGELVWQKSLIRDLGGKRPVYGYASSPAAIDGKLYLDVGGNTGSTACLAADTGKVIWQKGKGEAGYSTPFIMQHEGQSALVTFKGEALELRNPSDGSLLADYATTTRDFCNCATPIVTGKTLFISHTGGMGARALDWEKDKLTERWSDRSLGLLFHSGLPWGNHLLAFNDSLRGSNELRLMDLTTGEVLWKNTEIPRGNGVLADDGHAIFLTNLGELILAKVGADHLEILSRVQALPAKAWCQPVLSHRHLLCKNNNGDIICYDLSK